MLGAVTGVMGTLQATEVLKEILGIGQGLSAVGAEVVLARSPDALKGIDGLVVPGVGTARPAMNRLRRYRLRFAGGGERPVVGIALSRGCDLLVAASYGSRATAPGIEQAIRGLVDTTGFFDPLRRPPP